MSTFSNVNLKRGKMSTWRKIAAGTWDFPGDPTMYGKVTVRAESVEWLVNAYRARGVPMSSLTLLAHAVSRAIAKYPQVNSLLRFGKIYQRTDVNVCVAATLNNDEDITGILIRNCDQLSREEISDELSYKVAKLKAGEDVEFEKVKESIDKVPNAFMNLFMTFVSHLLYTFNLWLPGLGLEKDAMGSVQITTLGRYQVEEGYGPLDPYSRVPMMVVMGATREVPVVESGAVTVGREFSLCFTFDHRIVDGIISAKIMNEIKEILEEGPGAVQVSWEREFNLQKKETAAECGGLA